MTKRSDVGQDLSRRDFTKATVSAGVGILLSESRVPGGRTAAGRKRYAIVVWVGARRCTRKPSTRPSRDFRAGGVLRRERGSPRAGPGRGRRGGPASAGAVRGCGFRPHDRRGAAQIVIVTTPCACTTSTSAGRWRRRGRDQREGHDRRRGQVPADHRHPAPNRAQLSRHFNYRYSPPHPGEGPVDERHDRRRAVRRLPLDAQHPARRRLLPRCTPTSACPGASWSTRPPITSTW